MKFIQYLGLGLMYAGTVIMLSAWYPWIRFWFLTIPGVGIILLGLLLAILKLLVKSRT